jgi:hypothetical protein
VEADARSLLDRSPNDGAQTFQAQEKQAILRELDRAAGDVRNRPLVVYISTLGIVSSGKVLLIPVDGRPDDPSTWLPLDEVLSRVRRASTPRLLILDVRPSSNPRAALTGEDVNGLLDSSLAKLSESGELPFFVLTANTPPDGANILRAIKHSAFGLAIAQGAGGMADGWNADRKRDGRVSARELAAYVRELTYHISTTAGLPPQVARLHGTGGDFDIFTVPRDGPLPLPTLPDPETYPQWLTSAWKDREMWFHEGLHLHAPRVTRHLALAASRAERRWLAGGNTDAIKDSFDVVAKRLREVRPKLSPIHQPIGSVARAEQRSGLNSSSVADVLRPVFVRILESPGTVRDKALADAMKAVWDKPPEGEPFDAVAVATLTFTQNLVKPKHEQLKQLATFLNGLRPRPPRHAELLTITLIGSLTPDHVERWPEGTIATLVRIAREAEESAAIDGRCMPWVRDRLEKADTARRKGLHDLCAPKSTNAIREAAVAAIEAAGEDYKTVRAAAGALASAYREYEETRAVLVDLAVAYPYDALAGSEDLAMTWDSLVDYFRTVQQLLRPPATPALPDVAELGRAAQSLRAGREQLRAALRVPDGAAARQYEGLLGWPHWSLSERALLLTRLNEADRTATRRVLDRWPKEQPNHETAAIPPAGQRVMAGTISDIRRSIALLRLIDWPEAVDLKAELDRLGANPAPANVAELARKTRSSLRKRLPEMYVAADTDRQALIGWAVDPDDVPAFLQQGSAGPPNPELSERKNAERAYHIWLAAQRYTADWSTLSAIETPAVRSVANGFREIARLYNEAFP